MLADVRHAFKMIFRMPGLAAVVILSLAVGIGVNTAIFSWIQAVVLQPMPGVAGGARFYFVEPRAQTGSYPGVSWLEYRDLVEQVRTLPDLIAFRMAPFNVGAAARTERTYGLLVSGNYFSALGLRPAAGRFMRADEAAPGSREPVVVVSHEFWQSRMAGSPAALGETVRVNDVVLTVIGVTPPAFQGTVLGLKFDLFMPATLAPALFAGSRELEDRSVRGYAAMAKLAPGATRARAQADVDAAMRQLARDYPETNLALGAEVLPFWQAPHGPQRLLARALFGLQAIMLLLLLAVCGNTANLVLARASARQREIGVRAALGAAPARVVRLLLTENVVLALGGAALGIAIAIWGTNALRAVPFIGAFPIRFQTSVDPIGLAVAAGLGVLCGLMVGVIPAIQLARLDPQLALRAGASGGGRNGLRNTLMAVEVALAIVVLLAGGLFFRSFDEARETDPGFSREGVLLAAYDLSGKNIDRATARDFASRLLTRLRGLPSVEAAAVATSVPLDIHGLPVRSFTVDGRPRTSAAPDQALSNTVTPAYFKTMGIPFEKGRDFAALDDAAAQPQAVVNGEFVRRYLAGLEPVGRRLETRGTSYTIVGVVRTSLYDAFGESPLPIIYLSYRDRPSTAGEIHVRTRVGAEALVAPEIERAVRALDPALPIYDVRTMSDHIEKNLFLRRIPARMFVVLGPMLLVLAAIGIYAVVGYTVSRRTTEIGVRLALGATAATVVRQIVGASLRVIGVGAIAGWSVAFVIALHVVQGGRIDAVVFLGVPFALLLVSASACWVPARRAATVDPMTALRDE
ncbi:MAG TPA: ABC transporter permease [Vicinamibacterales bacterium]